VWGEKPVSEIGRDGERQFFETEISWNERPESGELPPNKPGDCLKSGFGARVMTQVGIPGFWSGLSGKSNWWPGREFGKWIASALHVRNSKASSAKRLVWSGRHVLHSTGGSFTAGMKFAEVNSHRVSGKNVGR